MNTHASVNRGLRKKKNANIMNGESVISQKTKHPANDGIEIAL
jgi:hypothetical protein